MADDRRGKTAPKQSNPGKIALLGTGATALALINMVSGSEAPRQAVALLQYALLAMGLVALVGGLIMMTAKK